MGKYDDIINLPHHVSKTRIPMPMENRAAQFAPFAALTGHEDAIAETARITADMIELTDEEKHSISKILVRALEENKKVTVTYFIKDKYKAGGTYETITDKIAKIDLPEQTIRFQNNLIIPLNSVTSATPISP